MGLSERNNVTYPSQQYVAAKPSTAATHVDPTLSSHHSRHNSAAELSGANANDESKMKTLEGGLQPGGVDGVRTTGDGRKDSEEHVPPTKTPKLVNAMKQPRSYQTHLVPGINTEKHPYEAGDENEA